LILSNSLKRKREERRDAVLVHATARGKKAKGKLMHGKKKKKGKKEKNYSSRRSR